MPSYKNGNYFVTILNDGTKIRKTEEDEFIPQFAENQDVKITDKCNIGCLFCLEPETIIATADGNKKISDITTNDLVYSFNEKTGDTELKPVIETYCRKFEKELIELETDNGTIRCTPNHKIYTKNRGFIPAEDICITDDILFLS